MKTTNQKTETPNQRTRHPIQDVRRAAVPIVLYETADPAETIASIIASQNGKAETYALMQHDVVRGLTGLNEKGQEVAEGIGDRLETQGLVDALSKVYDLLERTYMTPDAGGLRKCFLFVHNAHRFLGEISTVQAIWNLRDLFTKVGATMVLLGVNTQAPLELRQDVVTLSDPLPTPPEIAKIVTGLAEAAKKANCAVDPEEVSKDERLHDTLTGLSGFGVRQVFSMSLRSDGIDERILSERKRKLVEQTPGLSIWNGTESLDDLAGLANLKSFYKAILTSGRNPVRGIGFIDEIEKMMGGMSGDTSGTTQDQLGVILREMQDNNISGSILLSPPGCGKSNFVKALGKLAQAPVINFDLGSAKSKYVGESEGNIRAMMSVFRAVTQGKGIIIATCNQILNLPPELRRRFKLGTFFIDLPSAEERAGIWQIWMRKFGMDDEPKPDDTDWTGAEIAACVETAYRASIPLVEAAGYIVPVSQSAPEQIEGLRRMADGKFIDASRKGKYRKDFKPVAAMGTGRAFDSFEKAD